MNVAPVSVVIPTYNRRDLVCDAIDSALAQTLPPAEIIVVDDGSVTQTGEKLKQYGERIRYHYQANAGLSAARNTGMGLATQTYIGFLDDDDVWHPRKLELQMQALTRRPEVALIGAQQFDWPAAEFPPAPANVDGIVRPATWEQLVIKTFIPVSSVLVRRDVVEKVGGFDVQLKSSEDRDFFLRVAEVAPLAFIDTPLSGYRDTPGSMCKHALGREQSMRLILSRLDARDAWRGRWLLRRKAYGYMHHNLSDAHARAGGYPGSILRTLKSLAWYPLPFRPDEVHMPLERPKRVAVNLLRMMKLKSPDRDPSKRPAPAANALAPLRQNLTRTPAGA